MRGDHSFALSAGLVFLVLPCLAQQSLMESRNPKAAPDGATDALPTTYLKIASATPIAGISEPFLTTALCAPDKAIIVRLASMSGLRDLVSISNDGQTVVRFSPFRISDVDNPSFNYYFATKSDVYILTRSSIPQNGTVKLRTPTGEIVTQPKVLARDYIVQFQRDGTYVKSIPLDLTFYPRQIGVFPSGGFLVAGSAKDGTFKPVIALLKSSGEFDRYLELKGDIHLADANNKNDANDPTALPIRATRLEDREKSLSAAVGLSVIVPDGRNLLLVRSGQKAPIFSVSPGGEVRAVNPEVPPGFTLFDLRAGQGNWVALYTHPHSDDPKDASLSLETYALDPNSGKATARYVYPRFLGFGLACSDGFEFSLLERQDDKLQLIKLLPLYSYSSEKLEK